MVINIQDDILKLHAMGLLDRLLQDKATKGNILWATGAYSQLGEWYTPGNEIRPLRITGGNSDLIKTRARRAMEQRTERTRQHAEVFTPLWIVKKMNDFADKQWFGRKSGIYKLTEEGKIYFNTKELAEKAEDADSIFDIPDPCSQFETRILDKLAISEFTATLSERDMKILELKNRGSSVTEIAQLVGYQSHSAVVKRLKKITELYEDFVSKKYRQYLETF